MLGSVSQKVLTEAQCSVRIGRPTPGVGASAQRIVLGVDGSRGSTAAVREVGRRSWTPGSEVRVVVAQDLMKTFPVSIMLGGGGAADMRHLTHTVPQVRRIVAKFGPDAREDALEIESEDGARTLLVFETLPELPENL